MPRKSIPMDYTNEEAQRRTEAALRAAFNMPHKPMKEIPRKRPKTQRIDDLADMLDKGDPADIGADREEDR